MSDSITNRREQMLLCGRLIECALAMYATGKLNPTQPPDFPEQWIIVQNITAEAVAGFFAKKEFLGFVAKSLSEENLYAVVLHGSEGIVDFLDDFEFVLTDFSLVQDGGRTEYGFTRFYESFSFVDPETGSTQTLPDYISQLSSTEPRPVFIVTGHSLGGALATLHAVVLASRGIPVTIYTFAAPMVGDDAFVKRYNVLVQNSYRIVNKPDIVPQLPSALLGYAHVQSTVEINSLQYSEIKCSISCYHHLYTYLYVLGASDVDLGSCKANKT